MINKLICLLVVLMLTMIGTASAVGQIEAYDGNDWQIVSEEQFAGQPYPDYRYATKTIELPFATTKVRLTQNGTDTAHLDGAILDGTAPISVIDKSTDAELVPAKLAQADYDVIDAASRTIEISWADPGTVLDLTAVEENLFGVPLLWPQEGYLEYTLDGPETFSQYLIPISSHPASTFYATFSTTSEELVVDLDATGDNTLDPDGDWAELRIITPDGVKKFKINDTMKTWGTSTFEYTNMVTWEHKTYQFNIPLQEIGKSQGDDVQFQISYYGTLTVEGITLSPASDVNPIGTYHTVTATVYDELMNPVEGVEVIFGVVTGPHGGTTGNDTTDANGQAMFTYMGTGMGTDEIEAFFTDDRGNIILSDGVTTEWIPIVIQPQPNFDVPTAPPLLTVGALGIALVLFLRGKQD